MLTLQSPCCQSCGLPLSHDKTGGGTEKDQTRSTEYCGYCYQNGEFTDPEMTLEQMIHTVEEKLKEMYIPAFLASFFTRELARLKRWKT